MDKISIIVPVYKVEKYLDTCISSIINQTYENLEIILVDDGSPDNCPSMCDDWAKKDGRIKVVHKKNGGLSDARNAGLDIMTGDYVMFVDSDDYIDNVMCEEMLKLINHYNADICCSNFFEFYEGTPFEKKDTIKARVQTFEGNEVIQLLFNKKVPLIMVAWCKLYKAEIFKGLRFEVGRYHEDEFMIHHTLSRAKSFVHTSKKYYNYLQRFGSITHKPSKKNIEDSIEAFRQRDDFLRQNHSQCIEDINLHKMGNLRNLYARCGDYELREQIIEDFCNIYRISTKKNNKDRLFRVSPLIYSLICNLAQKSHVVRKKRG